MATTKVSGELVDLNESTSESGLKIPTGTNNNRPATDVAGMVRNNTNETSDGSASCEEYYNGAAWKKINNVAIPPIVGMSTLIWAGNGSTQPIAGLGFKPDFVWIKERTGTNPHALYDSVRGAGKLVSSNDQTAQTGNSGDLLGSFDANGFQVNRQYLTNTNYDTTNGLSNLNYVGWAWKGGGNSNTFNKDGTGYATASAAGLTTGTNNPTGSTINTESGFSAITLNAGATNNSDRTVAHGLGVKPAFVIMRRTDASAWFVWHQSLSQDSYYLYLQDDFDESDLTQSGNAWGNQSFTATNISWRNGWTFSTNEDLFAYCWAEVAGHSKMGSYAGNGSLAGPIVTTGFPVNFVLIKRIDGNSNWNIYDTSRDSSNPSGPPLYPNLNNPEGGTQAVNFLATGFQPYYSGGDINENGGTYIYVAFNQA